MVYSSLRNPLKPERVLFSLHETITGIMTIHYGREKDYPLGLLFTIIVAVVTLNTLLTEVTPKRALKGVK